MTASPGLLGMSADAALAAWARQVRANREQVETAIQIRIEEQAAETQAVAGRLPDARLHGDIGIRSVALRAACTA